MEKKCLALERNEQLKNFYILKLSYPDNQTVSHTTRIEGWRSDVQNTRTCKRSGHTAYTLYVPIVLSNYRIGIDRLQYNNVENRLSFAKMASDRQQDSKIYNPSYHLSFSIHRFSRIGFLGYVRVTLLTLRTRIKITILFVCAESACISQSLFTILRFDKTFSLVSNT